MVMLNAYWMRTKDLDPRMHVLSRHAHPGSAGLPSPTRLLRAMGLAALVVLCACSHPTGIDAPEGAEAMVRQIVGWRADDPDDDVVLYLDEWAAGDPGITSGSPPFVVAEPSILFRVKGDRLERASVRDVRWGERVEIWRPAGSAEIRQVRLLP